MAGSATALRPAGYPSGYPAEIDANVKIRWVDNLLVNMSERSTDLLKFIGGPSQFTFDNPKVEWVEDDVWGRRPTHTGLAAAGTLSLVVTGQAHRYPVGTLLYNSRVGEVVYVSAVADANTLTIVRDADGGSNAAAWLSTDEVMVQGQVMHETDSWTFRPNAIFQLPYNFAQVQHVGVHVTFRRQATALYGLRGTDLDYISANTVAEQFVAMEMSLAHGRRYEGASTKPAQMGGFRFYIKDGGSSESGSSITSDLGSAALTRKDIDDDLQEGFYAVGPEKMANTLIVSAWAKRKISDFWSSAERLGPLAGTAGIAIDRFRTDFGDINVLMHTAVAKNEMYFINRDSIKMGHFAGLGRPHLLQLAAPSATGPRIERAFYADVSCMVKGLEGMGILHTFSVSS